MSAIIIIHQCCCPFCEILFFNPYPFCEVPSFSPPLSFMCCLFFHLCSSVNLFPSHLLIVFLPNYIFTVQNFSVFSSAGSPQSLWFSSLTLLCLQCQSPSAHHFHISQAFCSVSSPASILLTALSPMMGVHSSNLVLPCLSWKWKRSKMQAGVKDVGRAQTERSEDLGVSTPLKRQKEESVQDLESMWVGGMQVALHPHTSELEDPLAHLRQGERNVFHVLLSFCAPCSSRSTGPSNHLHGIRDICVRDLDPPWEWRVPHPVFPRGI